MRFLPGLIVATGIYAQSNLVLLGVGGPSTAGSSCGTWAHCASITAAAAQSGSANSSNFPVAVVITSTIGSYLKTTANGGQVHNSVTQTGGNGGTEPADAVFGTTASCATLLPWETEYYSAAGTASGGQQSGYWIAWVQLPTLSASSNTTFYVCWGNNAVSTQQNTGSYAPAKVWDASTLAVWHVPNGSSLVTDDSTSNANNATASGSPSAGAGEIDGGLSLTAASSQYISVANNASLSFSQFTCSVWFKWSGTVTGSSWMSPCSKGNYAGNEFSVLIYSPAPVINLYIEGSNYINYTWSGHDTNWHNLVVTSSSSAQQLYLDGASVATASGSVSITNSAATLSMGNDPVHAYYWDGTLDELVLSNAVRSSSWVTAMFNSQKPGSTFLSWGLIQ